MVRVDVLRCPTCGAAVPLGLEDVPRVRCASCGAEVPIPAQHRDLRAALLADRAARARGEAILARLARPPSSFARMLATSTPAAVFVLTPLIASAALLIPLAKIFAHEVLHIEPADVLSPIDDGALGALWLFVALAPTLLLVRARRSARWRIGLQRALAAADPERDGGPARCRSCGAPLDVADDAVSARCAYCGTDSLVVVDRAWSKHVAKVSSAIVTTAEDAREADRIQRRADRTQLLLALSGIALLAFTSGAISPFFEQSDDQQVAWRDAVDGAAILYRTRALEDLRDRPPLAAGASKLAYSCAVAPCTLEYHAALRRGDRLRVRVASSKPTVTVSLADEYRGVVASRVLAAGDVVELAAEDSAWHAFAIDFGPPAVRGDFTLEVERVR